MPKPSRPMKLTEIMNLHAYFIRLTPPLSEPAKDILREIEEHVLSVIQNERTPTQTQTNLKDAEDRMFIHTMKEQTHFLNPTQPDPTLAPNYIHYKDNL